jgi:hypothetical protein
MSFLNSFVCHKCGEPFPFFIRPAIRINRGLLLPYLKCQNCGQLSQQKIDVLSAAWVWPLSIGLFMAAVYALRNFLNGESHFLYLLIVVMLLAPLFIGLRKGLKLVPVNNNQKSQSMLNKWVIPLICITLCALIFGYYTQDLLNVVMGFSIGLIAWLLFYYRSGKRSKKENR